MRRRNRRRIQYNFEDIYFKPQGIPLSSLEETVLSTEELETLRLRYLKGLAQDEAAYQMGISQSQYQRDITKALKKITEALIEGKAINIQETKNN